MQVRVDRSTKLPRRIAGRISAILALLTFASAAYAHTPHHVIDDLELSPEYANDTTLFVLVHNYLLRSSDRAGSWTPLGSGIDTPFVLTDIEVSGRFETDDTLFVATAGSGVFRSVDRGDSWQRFNAGLNQLDIGKLLQVENNGDYFLVAAGSARGLFGSSAAEARWQRLLSDDVQITALVQIEHAGEASILAGDSDGGIWRSGPGFENWRRIARLESAGAITAFAADPREGQQATALVGTDKSGLLRMSVDGAVIEKMPQNWPDSAAAECGRRANPSVRDIEIGGDGSRVFFTTWSDALYVMARDKKSYDVLDRGLRCDVQADHNSFQTPHFRGIEFGGDDSDWFMATFEGLFRSVDQGKTWVSLETMPVSVIRGIGISTAHEEQHSLLLTTYGGGAYLTSDRGQTWTIMNHGLFTTRLADAEFLPDSTGDDQIFALSRGRLLTAAGPGDTWTAKNLNERSWLEQLEAKVFGSVRRSNVWPMHIELSPAYTDDQTMLLGFRRAGIWVSQDAGESWDRDWAGPTDYVTDMKISPDFANDKTAFAAFRGAGIYVTRDGGATWEPSNNGFDFLADYKARKAPNHLVDPPLSRAITDAVLAVSPQFAHDQTVFAGSAAGLFRSKDGGKRWHEVPVFSDASNTSVIGLAISPNYANDETVVVSVKGKGLYRSTDGGESFKQLNRALNTASFEPKFIAFSPGFESDNIIYAADDWSLRVSQDGADSWTRVTRPSRYEDSRGAYSGPVWFSGDWQRETGANLSASTQTVTQQPGATAVLNFSGTSISWYGERGPAGGTARVSIDGRDVGTVDLSAEQVNRNAALFSTDDLGPGAHDIVVRALNGRVTVDYFDVGQQNDDQ